MKKYASVRRTLPSKPGLALLSQRNSFFVTPSSSSPSSIRLRMYIHLGVNTAWIFLFFFLLLLFSSPFTTFSFLPTSKRPEIGRQPKTTNQAPEKHFPFSSFFISFLSYFFSMSMYLFSIVRGYQFIHDSVTPSSTVCSFSPSDFCRCAQPTADKWLFTPFDTTFRCLDRCFVY